MPDAEDALRTALEQNPDLALRVIETLQAMIDTFNALPFETQVLIAAVASASERAS